MQPKCFLSYSQEEALELSLFFFLNPQTWLSLVMGDSLVTPMLKRPKSLWTCNLDHLCSSEPYFLWPPDPESMAGTTQNLTSCVNDRHDGFTHVLVSTGAWAAMLLKGIILIRPEKRHLPASPLLLWGQMTCLKMCHGIPALRATCFDRLPHTQSWLKHFSQACSENPTLALN